MTRPSYFAAYELGCMRPMAEWQWPYATEHLFKGAPPLDIDEVTVVMQDLYESALHEGHLVLVQQGAVINHLAAVGLVHHQTRAFQ